MLPKDWQQLPLGDIAQITSGGTPDRATSIYWGGDIPWVTTGEIQFNTITDTEERITEDGLRNSSAKLFPPNTLLIAMYGQGKTRGQVARLGIHAATNQACAAILLKDGHDPEFYFQVLASHYEAIRELGNAGTQKNLNGAIIKQISVPVPPPLEQKQIAQVVEVWDRAIATAERLLANSRKQKQALMIRFLRKQEKWKLVRLDSISTRIRRESDGGGHPVLMISSTSGFVSQSDMYSRFMAGKSLENYVLLRKGEFAYNKGNSKSYEFGCIYPLDTFEQGLVPHVYVCFSMDERTCFRPFYKYLFEYDYLHDQLGALVNTGVRNNGLLNIRPADFFGTKVPVPSMKEQKEIAKALDVASNVIRRVEQTVEGLKAEKAALMQQLLTGKRRLMLVNA